MMFIGTNSYILQLLKCLNIILYEGGGVAPVCLSVYLFVWRMGQPASWLSVWYQYIYIYTVTLYHVYWTFVCLFVRACVCVCEYQ